MSRINAAALGAALLIGFAGFAGAQAPGSQGPGVRPPVDGRRPGMERRRVGRPRSPRGFNEKFAKELKLSDAQQARIKAIHAKYESEFKAVRDRTKAQNETARTPRAKGDTAAARAYAKARAGVRQQMQSIRQREQAEILTVLTPEQRAKYDAAQALRKKRMEDRGRKGPGAHRHGRYDRGALPRRG